MAYTSPPTFTLNQMITAAILNAYLRDNMSAIWKGTTAGDLDYYTSSSDKARLGIGFPYQVLQTNSAGNAPQWSNGIYAKAYYSAPFAVASGGDQAYFGLDIEDIDPNGFHSASNPHFVVPAGLTGFYMVGANGYFDNHATAGKLREIGIKQNASFISKFSTVNDGAAATWVNIVCGAYLTAGDTIKPYILQTSGTNLNFTLATLWLAKIR